MISKGAHKLAKLRQWPEVMVQGAGLGGKAKDRPISMEAITQFEIFSTISRKAGVKEPDTQQLSPLYR